MSDEPLTRAVLASAFADFQRLVMEPQFQRLHGRLDGLDAAFGDINAHFDDIYRRFDRLETEYVAIKAGLARVEERLDRVEQRLERLELGYRELLAALHRLEERLSRVERQVDQMAAAQEKHALRSEVQDLKARVDALHDEIRRLEQRLQG